jgi:hypothetical protein
MLIKEKSKIAEEVLTMLILWALVILESPSQPLFNAELMTWPNN